MGLCLDSTPEMGEYSVEIRRESFYLRGEDSYNKPRRHAFELYLSSKIRAALDLVEQHKRTTR